MALCIAHYSWTIHFCVTCLFFYRGGKVWDVLSIQHEPKTCVIHRVEYGAEHDAEQAIKRSGKPLVFWQYCSYVQSQFIQLLFYVNPPYLTSRLAMGLLHASMLYVFLFPLLWWCVCLLRRFELSLVEGFISRLMLHSWEYPARKLFNACSAELVMWYNFASNICLRYTYQVVRPKRLPKCNCCTWCFRWACGILHVCYGSTWRVLLFMICSDNTPTIQNRLGFNKNIVRAVGLSDTLPSMPIMFETGDSSFNHFIRGEGGFDILDATRRVCYVERGRRLKYCRVFYRALRGGKVVPQALHARRTQQTWQNVCLAQALFFVFNWSSSSFIMG